MVTVAFALRLSQKVQFEGFYTNVLNTVTFEGCLCVSLASQSTHNPTCVTLFSGLSEMANLFDGTGGIMITLNLKDYSSALFMHVVYRAIFHSLKM